MNLEFIKKYLQNYLDFVLNKRYSKKMEEMGLPPIEFTVNQIFKGSYQPPRVHVFLDSNPELKKKTGLKPWAIMLMSGVDKDIKDFMKSLSIPYDIKVHWNKTPSIKNDSIYTED